MIYIYIYIYIFCTNFHKNVHNFQTNNLTYKVRRSQVGLDSSVGRALARQSGGRRFKSRSSTFFVVHPNLSKNVPTQFPLWFIT